MFASLDKRCAAADVADIVETLKTGWLAPGKKASALELETAQKCGKAFGLLVNSHKSAVFLSCIACHIGPGSLAVTATRKMDEEYEEDHGAV